MANDGPQLADPPGGSNTDYEKAYPQRAQLPSEPLERPALPSEPLERPALPSEPLTRRRLGD
jgi:hypothetical protein